MASPSPSYTPYVPRRTHTSTSSTSSFVLSPPTLPPPPHTPSPLVASSTSRTTTGTAPLRAPQPSRPAIPLQWSGFSTASTSTATSSSAAHPTTSPPPSHSRSHSHSHNGSVRATPPPSAFPFSTVPSTQSPFDSPRGRRSPEKQHPDVPTYKRAQSGAQTNGKTPYRPGFQPQGVRIDRSSEFFASRKKKTEMRKLDEARLSRRLEKLVALHFSPVGHKSSKPPPKESALSSISSFGDTLRTRSAKELWRSVAGNVDLEIERAEQSIVKWQADREASHCPICTAAFGVRVRRHHCRLCGRVVCFLPPTPPSALPSSSPSASLASPPPSDTPLPPPTPVRRERCSTFFTYEQQVFPPAEPGEEKRVYGVVTEVPTVEQDLSIDGMLGVGGAGGSSATEKEKDERKKVRVCRDCLNMVLRQQMKTLPIRTPTWLKLYEVLVQLEEEIEETLPEFQELAIILQNPHKALASANPPSASHAASLRKRLLTTLASYDTLSKRLRDLPLPPGAPVGGSQDRLQRALAARGGMYLGEKLGLLRSLGNVEELGGGGATGGGKGKGKEEEKGREGVKTLASLVGDEGMARIAEKVGPELEAVAQLQVLREQEALVKSYVDDANSRRQFEDAFALQASLDELRAEIAHISASLP